jgi:hypothetical protein
MRPQKAVVFSLVATEKSYDILDDGTPVAVVSYLKNKGGKIALDGREYSVKREGGPSDEMLGQALLRMVTGRKRVPATWSLLGPDGKMLASAEHSKEGFAVTRGTDRLAFRNSKKAGFQLFREGSAEPLGSSKGMSLPAEFDLPFQAFLFVLAIALAEEDLAGVDGSAVSVDT